MTASRRAGPVSQMSRALARGAIALIQLYRNTISPLRLPTCRFTPTCSEYAVDALTEHGLLRGAWLAAVRLVKCGPWHPGGWDPIPERAQHSCGADMSGERTAEQLVWDAPAKRGESKSRV